MIDLDYFKKVNDTYDHKAGDYILTCVSEIIRKNIRKSDIAARFGGEEFCLLLNVKKDQEAFTIIEKIRKTIETQKFIFENKSLSATVSCGMTNELENSFEDMIKRADIIQGKRKRQKQDNGL